MSSPGASEPGAIGGFDDSTVARLFSKKSLFSKRVNWRPITVAPRPLKMAAGRMPVYCTMGGVSDSAPVPRASSAPVSIGPPIFISYTDLSSLLRSGVRFKYRSITLFSLMLDPSPRR